MGRDKRGEKGEGDKWEERRIKKKKGLEKRGQLDAKELEEDGVKRKADEEGRMWGGWCYEEEWGEGRR